MQIASDMRLAISSEPPTAQVARRRVPAAERREQILAAATQVVARQGMSAASTAEIARLAGISHGYLFRLFPTKEELLLAVARSCSGSMLHELISAGQAAHATGTESLAAVRRRWGELLEGSVLLQVSLQSIAASQRVPALGAQLRDAWEVTVAEIQRISGAEADAVREVVAEGMLLIVSSGFIEPPVR